MPEVKRKQTSRRMTDETLKIVRDRQEAKAKSDQAE